MDAVDEIESNPSQAQEGRQQALGIQAAAVTENATTKAMLTSSEAESQKAAEERDFLAWNRSAKEGLVGEYLR